MGNVAKNRHDQAVKIVSKALRSSKDKRDDALRELIEFCADEIAKGLNEGGILLAFSAPQHKANIARALAYRSAERVIGTAKEKSSWICRNTSKPARPRSHEKSGWSRRYG